MKKVLLLLVLTIGMLVASTSVFAANVINVSLQESVSQVYAFNPELGEVTSGSSSTGISLVPRNITGKVIISNVAADDVSAVNVTLNNTFNIPYQFDILSQPPGVSANISAFTVGSPVYVYIKVLENGTNVTLNYTVDSTYVGEPIDINVSYSKTRVLTNDTLTVSITAGNMLNNSRAIQISDILLNITPQPYLGADSKNKYFNFSSVGGPDSGNATIYTYMDGTGVNYSSLAWNISNRTLDVGDNNTITYVARAPVDLNGSWNQTNWGQFMVIGNISADFLANETISGLTVTDVMASSDASITALKRRVNETHWRGGINFSNVATGVDYNLTSFTVFATNYGQTDDPGDVFTWIGTVINTTILGDVLNATEDVTILDINDDGSNDTVSLDTNLSALVFNVTGFGNITVQLTNATGVVNISDVADWVVVNMSRTPIGQVGYITLEANTSSATHINGSINITIWEKPDNVEDNSGSYYLSNVGSSVAAGESFQYNAVDFAYENVPVVWADATHIILDDGTQIQRINTTIDTEGDYLFVQEIFVVSGYIIKATKEILPHGGDDFDNIYNITIVVENIGNDKTPDRVTLFDMIPPDFFPYNVSDSQTSDNRTMEELRNLFVRPSNMSRGINNTGIIENTNSLYFNYSGFNIDMYAISKMSNGDGMFDRDNITYQMPDVTNVSFVSTTIDLDDDGVIDVVRVDNRTHKRLEFNLSRWGLRYVDFVDHNTGGDLNISQICIGGINCTSANFSVNNVTLLDGNGETLAYIYLNGSTDTNGSLENISGGGDSNFTIYEKEDVREVEVFYMLNGTNPLSHIRNVYVVGVDPQFIEGAHGSAELRSGFEAASKTYESIILGMTIIATVGLVSFSISTRKKL